MNRIIQKSGRANQTWTKLRANIFAIFASQIMHQKICKNVQMCLLLEKTTLIFFKIFLWLVYLKKEKNENGQIRHYSFKMADNDLKIWQNYLLPNPFHMVDAKFDLVLRPISHGNPAMPFLELFFSVYNMLKLEKCWYLNSISQLNYMRFEKTSWYKILYYKKIYKFFLTQFLIKWKF